MEPWSIKSLPLCSISLFADHTVPRRRFDYNEAQIYAYSMTLIYYYLPLREVALWPVYVYFTRPRFQFSSSETSYNA
jgi:hypothetical protein